MDRAKKIHIKFKKLLKRLKGLGIIKTFKLEINFYPVERNLIKFLVEIDSVLKKCLRKILIKPRRAEIRNIITELVRKKNLNHLVISKEEVREKNLCFTKCPTKDLTGITLKFPCGFCEKTFSSRKTFVAHKKLHLNLLKSETYLCEKCGELFHSSKKWKKHAHMYNEKNRLCLFSRYCQGDIRHDSPYEEECLKEPTQIVINKSVISDVPTTDEALKTSVQNMENHMSQTTDEKKFTCSCGKVFRVWKSFKKHEKLKHSLVNTKYTCQSCGKCFMEKGKLNRHMLSHKESQYRCSHCSKLFVRSDTLKRHLSMCHYISQEFCCSFCPKKFKLKYNRNVHEENIHKNISHYVHCEHCGQKFRNKIALKGHLKTHLKSRITCTVCCKSFARKTYYEKHVKSKHFSPQKQFGSNST